MESIREYIRSVRPVSLSRIAGYSAQTAYALKKHKRLKSKKLSAAKRKALGSMKQLRKELLQRKRAAAAHRSAQLRNK